MDLWNQILSKEADIYINIFITIFGLFLGYLIDKVKNKDPQVHVGDTTHTTNTVNITKIISESKKSPHRKSNDDQLFMIFMGAVLISVGITYLFYREEILTTIRYLSLFSFSLWGGGTAHSIIKRQFEGLNWFLYLMFIVIFVIASLFIIDQAFTPKYPPTHFEYSQQIINERGVYGLSGVFSAKDGVWFLVHLFGVLLIFGSQYIMLMSSIYFATMGRYIIRGQVDDEPWIARKVKRYGNFYKNIIFVSLMMFMSYFLVSGIFLLWIENDLPVHVNNFIYTVLHGR